MSKSLGNVVVPDDMVAKYGADSTRLYTLFAAPPDRDLDWQDLGVEGISRFLARVYRFVLRNARQDNAARSVRNGAELSPAARQVQRKMHQTVKRVTDDFGGRWHFNTSIAAIMEFVNELYAFEDSVHRGGPPAPMGLIADAQRNLVLMLAPFAPYLAHELWEVLGENSILLREPWPKYDPELAKEEQVEIVLQVNGKNRSRIIVPIDADEEHVRELAQADEKIKMMVQGKQVMKVIIVKGKLVNIVAR
jgi:leucyl-tRNA synthetase